MADWWENYPWRMIQTNLREIDMRDIRAAQVVADLRAFKATALLLNAAGIIASYPTKLPFHFQSPFLTGDSLAEIIDACHQAGIRVLARTDFSKVRRPIYEAHPDWAYQTAEGQIVDYNGDVHVCINGPYQQDYALRIMEELFETLPFDGIFFNMGGYQTRDYSGNDYGPCHCPHCQRRFREMFDLPLPVVEDMADPVYRRYLVFKERTQREHHQKVYRFLSQRWPHLCIANHPEFRRGFIRQESNTALDRPLPHWQYSGSANTKWAVGTYPELVSSNTSVDFIDYPYRHVAVSPHQQALRLAQNLANGGAIDFYLIGRLDNHQDRSGFAPVREIFHYHAAHEATYSDLRSRATIALLDGPLANQAEFRGWYRFLTEGHYCFDVLRVQGLAEIDLARYQALILPDLQPLSDRLAARLDRFVEGGGRLVVVGRTGFLDDAYQARERPALRSAGIAQVQRVRAEARSSYLYLNDKQDLPRFADAELVYLDGLYIYADYAPAAEPRLKLIPPHNFGPPERCYYDLVTDHPGYVIHPYGQGNVVYLPWLPGQSFHRQGYPNTADFCLDLLETAAGLSPLVDNLSPMIEVTLFEKADGSYQLLHLVNGSGHFGNSFFSPLPLTDLTLTLSLEQKPQRVSGLRAGKAFPFDWQVGRLTITVPRLDLFEALKIEFSG